MVKSTNKPCPLCMKCGKRVRLLLFFFFWVKWVSEQPGSRWRIRHKKTSFNICSVAEAEFGWQIIRAKVKPFWKRIGFFSLEVCNPTSDPKTRLRKTQGGSWGTALPLLHEEPELKEKWSHLHWCFWHFDVAPVSCSIFQRAGSGQQRWLRAQCQDGCL